MNAMVRKISATVVLTTLALALTACDPPMPPEVEAQIMEQSFTCIDGAVTANFPAAMADPAAQWVDGMTTACVDPLPVMNIKLADAPNSADLIVSDQALDAAVCKPLFSVPFALEAGDVAYQLSDITELNLSPKTLAAILNGQIKNWNDPAIAADNPDSTFPDKAIALRPTADANALTAISDWMTRRGAEVKTAIKPVASDPVTELAEGQIAIVTNSQVVANSLTAASVLLGTNKETGEAQLAVADNTGIASAGSQLKAKASGATVTFVIDDKIKPLAQEGMNEAAQPYQAIYAVNLNACGDESELKRAAAVFLLRLDSQGALGASNYNQLPEQVRYQSIAVAKKGLKLNTPAANDGN